MILALSQAYTAGPWQVWRTLTGRELGTPIHTIGSEAGARTPYELAHIESGRHGLGVHLQKTADSSLGILQALPTLPFPGSILPVTVGGGREPNEGDLGDPYICNFQLRWGYGYGLLPILIAVSELPAATPLCTTQERYIACKVWIPLRHLHLAFLAV